MKFPMIMKKIDLFSFELIEKFKDQPAYQKIVDEYNILEEWQQGIVKAILMVLTVLIPATLLLITFLFYSSQKSELNMYNNYIEQTATIINQTRDLEVKSRSVFGRPISNQGLLNSKLGTILSAVGIDSNNVKVEEFDSFETSGVTELTANLVFKEFSDNNFFAFMRRLLFVENFKIRHFQIEKNTASNLLEGKLGISYYSKIEVDENE